MHTWLDDCVETMENEEEEDEEEEGEKEEKVSSAGVLANWLANNLNHCFVHYHGV